MKRFILFLYSCFCLLNASGQQLDIDLFAGISNYQGDLQPQVLTLQNAKASASISVKYQIVRNLFARGGFAFGKVVGDDSKNREDLKPRNLSFQSGIQEFNLGLEYRFLNPAKFPVTPYLFAGVGFFKFNPYAFADQVNGRIYLQPLSTEGQGLSAYPDNKPYALSQICIPYGFGVKWQINCNLNIGIEFRQTKLFTDHLDDVSGPYVDQNVLLRERGQLAVDMAWRGDEYDGSPYPFAGRTRGNPKENDWYYFAGFTVGLRLKDCETGKFSLGGLFSKGKANARIDCPKVW